LLLVASLAPLPPACTVTHERGKYTLGKHVEDAR
jgi:hypothetical protein